MSDRESEGVPQEQSGQRPDPVNHRPPEEWRPGDAGDPIEGGPQPPGEPPHRFPHQETQPGEGRLPHGRHESPPSTGAHAYGEPSAGGGAPADVPPSGHPTGAPPEPVTGELSEGPSGPGQAGYEHAGYAPGYGESDGTATGAGGQPPGGPPDNFSSGQGPGYAAAGGYPSGQGPGYAPGQTGGYGQAYGYGPEPGAGQGYPPQGGYGPPEARPTPWGKIIGLSCAVLLLLMFVIAGCTTVALFAAAHRQTPVEETESRQEGGEAAGPRAELTAAPTDFDPGPLYTEGEYTSVDVSVTNTGQEDIEVNPLYFRVVDAQGDQHSTSEAVGMDADEIGARTLAPGQSVSGVITVEGDVEPETVVFSPFFGEPVEVPVS
ncbi:DUF4352 domain-containing protein [Nocardiopsis deserti]|nr:DUF4352 domain-containing protein [Nocardiopsis deserti]